ncbi:hypothetical protein Btru_025374 [Bulinus truncatus]|nr:hypothetical protein Btru_025374 [Bulinus truncatus]
MLTDALPITTTSLYSNTYISEVLEEPIKTSATTPGYGMSKSTQLRSDFESQIIIFVNHFLLCATIGLFGTVFNVINVRVLLKQGLSTSLNICLFFIAVFDLIKILTMQSTNLFSNPFLINMSDSQITLGAFYLIGGWPATCAHRISMFITGYVTAEQCLCISVPLKIKRWATPRRALVAILIIQIANIVSIIPEYSSIYIDWVFLPATNKTVLGLVPNGNRPALRGMVFKIHVAFLVVGIVSVISLASTLVFLLRQKSEWRVRHTVDGRQKQTLSVRDQKTCKLVILMAAVVIVCYLPVVIISLATIAIPEFNADGKLSTLFTTVWSFGHVFGISNSSVNIFIYYNLSSNYRLKFRECFSLCYRVI